MTTLIPIDQGRLWKRHMAMAQIGALPGAASIVPPCPRAMPRRAASCPLGGGTGLFRRNRSHRQPVRPPSGYRRNFSSRRRLASGHPADRRQFDGAFGVLAAFEALQAINEAGIVTRRPRSKSCPGPTRRARAFSPAAPVPPPSRAPSHWKSIWTRLTATATTARDALAAVLSTERGMPVRRSASRSRRSWNAIEQGPKLEEAGVRSAS